MKRTSDIAFTRTMVPLLCGLACFMLSLRTNLFLDSPSLYDGSAMICYGVLLAVTAVVGVRLVFKHKYRYGASVLVGLLLPFLVWPLMKAA